MPQVNAVAVLGEARRVYVFHAALVVSTSAVIQAVQCAISLYAVNTWGPSVGALMMIVLASVSGQLTIGAYTLLLLHLRAGHHLPTVGYLIKEAGSRIGPLFVLACISGAGVLLGYMFFVLPGLILSMRWSVAAPAFIARKLSPRQALGLSNELTKPAMGSVFLILLVQGLCGVGFGQLAAVSGNQFAPEDLILLQAVVATLFLPFASLAIAELFFALSGFEPTSHMAGQAAIAPYLPGGNAAARASAPAAAPQLAHLQPDVAAFLQASPAAPVAAAVPGPPHHYAPPQHDAPPVAHVAPAPSVQRPTPAPAPLPAQASDRSGSVAPPGFG